MKRVLVVSFIFIFFVSAFSAFFKINDGRLPLASFKRIVRMTDDLGSTNSQYLFDTPSGMGYMSFDGSNTLVDFNLWGYKGNVFSLYGHNNDVAFLYEPGAVDPNTKGVYFADDAMGSSSYTISDDLYGMSVVDSRAYIIRGGAFTNTAKFTVVDLGNPISFVSTQTIDTLATAGVQKAKVVQHPGKNDIFYVLFPGTPIIYAVSVNEYMGYNSNPKVMDLWDVTAQGTVFTDFDVSSDTPTEQLMAVQENGNFILLNIDDNTGNHTNAYSISSGNYTSNMGSQGASMMTGGAHNMFYLVNDDKNAVYRYYNDSADNWSSDVDVTGTGNINGISSDIIGDRILVSVYNEDFYCYEGATFPSRLTFNFNDIGATFESPVRIAGNGNGYMLFSEYGNVHFSDAIDFNSGFIGSMNVYTDPIYSIWDSNEWTMGALQSDDNIFAFYNSGAVTRGLIDTTHSTVAVQEKRLIGDSGAAINKPLLVIDGKMWVPELKGIGILESGGNTYAHFIELDAVSGAPEFMTYDEARGYVIGGYSNKIFAIDASSYSILHNQTMDNVGMSWPDWISFCYNPDDYLYYYKNLDFGTGDIAVGSFATIDNPTHVNTYSHGVEIYDMDTFDSGILAFSDSSGDITFGRLDSSGTLNNSEVHNFPGVTSDAEFQTVGSGYLMIYTGDSGNYEIWSYSNLQAPQNVEATAQSHQSIEVRWSDINDSENAFVIVYRVSGTADWQEAGIVPSTDNTFLMTGLQPDTNYEFMLYAVNDDFTSPPSAVVNATTFSEPDLGITPYPNPTWGPVTLEGCSTSGSIRVFTQDGFEIGDWYPDGETFTFDLRDGHGEMISGKYFLIYKASEQAEAEIRMIFYIEGHDGATK